MRNNKPGWCRRCQHHRTDHIGRSVPGKGMRLTACALPDCACEGFARGYVTSCPALAQRPARDEARRALAAPPPPGPTGGASLYAELSRWERASDEDLTRVDNGTGNGPPPPAAGLAESQAREALDYYVREILNYKKPTDEHPHSACSFSRVMNEFNRMALAALAPPPAAGRAEALARSTVVCGRCRHEEWHHAPSGIGCEFGMEDGECLCDGFVALAPRPARGAGETEGTP